MKFHRHGFKLVLPTAMTLRWVEGSELLLKQPQEPIKEFPHAASNAGNYPDVTGWPRGQSTEYSSSSICHISQSILMKKTPPCGWQEPPSLSSAQFCQGDPGPPVFRCRFGPRARPLPLVPDHNSQCDGTKGKIVPSHLSHQLTLREWVP